MILSGLSVFVNEKKMFVESFIGFGFSSESWRVRHDGTWTMEMGDIRIKNKPIKQEIRTQDNPNPSNGYDHRHPQPTAMITYVDSTCRKQIGLVQLHPTVQNQHWLNKIFYLPVYLTKKQVLLRLRRQQRETEIRFALLKRGSTQWRSLSSLRSHQNPNFWTRIFLVFIDLFKFSWISISSCIVLAMRLLIAAIALRREETQACDRNPRFF